MAMPLPLGPFARTEESLADALVQCSWFQKFTKLVFAPGTSEPDQLAALRSRIHFDHIPNPTVEGEVVSFPHLAQLRPFVCLWPSQPAGRFASMAGTYTVAVSSDFQLYFEAAEGDALLDQPSIDATKPNELFRWWLNMMGVLLVGDSQLPASGLILQPNIDIGRIVEVDMWHTQASGLGSYFSAICTVQMGAGT
jgi:hypothetical protein